jgi:hypothetical protein
MIIVGLAGGFFTGTCLRLFGAFHPLEAAFAFVILLRRLVMPANVPEGGRSAAPAVLTTCAADPERPDIRIREHRAGAVRLDGDGSRK